MARQQMKQITLQAHGMIRYFGRQPKARTAMMTRQEYISASPENARAAHRRYYGQFVNQRTIDYVVRAIGSDRLLASTDPHFNDVPLLEWDHLVFRLPLAASLRDAGDYMTLGNGVCIAKEAARQYVESKS